jgi:hypothetical protein
VHGAMVRHYQKVSERNDHFVVGHDPIQELHMHDYHYMMEYFSIITTDHFHKLHRLLMGRVLSMALSNLFEKE